MSSSPWILRPQLETLNPAVPNWVDPARMQQQRHRWGLHPSRRPPPPPQQQSICRFDRIWSTRDSAAGEHGFYFRVMVDILYEKTRVVDPDWVNADPDPQNHWIRIQCDPDLMRTRVHDRTVEDNFCSKCLKSEYKVPVKNINLYYFVPLSYKNYQKCT
jgi:hypothetical protein